MKARALAIEFYVYQDSDNTGQCRFAMPHKVDSSGSIIAWRQCLKRGTSHRITGYHFCQAHARYLVAKGVGTDEGTAAKGNER